MKNKYTPEIRFSGFTGEFKKRKLGEISEKVTEKNKNNIYSETLTNSAEFGIINQREFFDKDISNTKNLDGYYIVRPDDFVYNPRISSLAPVGPINRNKLGKSGVMSPLYYVFRTHDVDKTYLEKYFLTSKWHKFMIKNGDSGARSDRFAIKDAVFREMPIPIPSLEEQKKIGNFFEQLDNVITVYQQELNTLKQAKQGFMQKMFPKKGEKVPEVRFPGFTGDWEQCKLKKVAEIYDGTHQTPEYKDNGIMFLSVENIKTLKSNKFISEEAFEKEFKVRPEKNDVLMTRIGDIGTANVVKDSTPIAYYVSLALIKSKRLNPYFLQASIHSPFMKNELWKRTLHIAFPKKINKNEISNVLINFPDMEEQTKIGNFFRQLDDTINLHQRELDSLKEMKKAFLQKMFV